MIISRRLPFRFASSSFVSDLLTFPATNFSTSTSAVLPIIKSSDDQIGTMQEIEYYGQKKQTPVSLKALMETGRGIQLSAFTTTSTSDSTPHEARKKAEQVIIQVACFLHRELPIRLAHRVVELEASPLFMKSGHIRNVCNWYKTSFAQLRRCHAPNTREKEIEFSKVIESIYERHSSTLITMAKGAHEIRGMLGQDIASFAEHNDIQKRLDDFYMSRIAIRMVESLSACKNKFNYFFANHFNFFAFIYYFFVCAIHIAYRSIFSFTKANFE